MILIKWLMSLCLVWDLVWFQSLIITDKYQIFKITSLTFWCDFCLCQSGNLYWYSIFINVLILLLYNIDGEHDDMLFCSSLLMVSRLIKDAVGLILEDSTSLTIWSNFFHLNTPITCEYSLVDVMVLLSKYYMYKSSDHLYKIQKGSVYMGEGWGPKDGALLYCTRLCFRSSIISGNIVAFTPLWSLKFCSVSLKIGLLIERGQGSWREN